MTGRDNQSLSDIYPTVYVRIDPNPCKVALCHCTLVPLTGARCIIIGRFTYNPCFNVRVSYKMQWSYIGIEESCKQRICEVDTR